MIVYLTYTFNVTKTQIIDHWWIFLLHVHVTNKIVRDIEQRNIELRPSESFKFVSTSNKLVSQNGADLMKSPGFHFAEASLLPLKYF